MIQSPTDWIHIIIHFPYVKSTNSLKIYFFTNEEICSNDYVKHENWLRFATPATIHVLGEVLW